VKAKEKKKEKCIPRLKIFYLYITVLPLAKHSFFSLRTPIPLPLFDNLEEKKNETT
jgi:hypothetical protein